MDNHHCLITTIREEGLKGAGTGPLAGVRYVVKDLFDVADVPTTAGNPEFSSWYGTPTQSAWAVKALHAAGAVLVGKAQLHELAYGITGINPHFGTSRNPAAPDRIPGGSSSGSATAVAAGFVPFSLGTDTGGSIRIPASFCGIYGFRPTYGYIPVNRVVSLAPSFDTVGVLAASTKLLRQVANVLLRFPTSRSTGNLKRAFVSIDGVGLAGPAGQQAVAEIARRLEKIGLFISDIQLNLLEDARETQGVLQGAEAWSVHEKWVTTRLPELGSDVEQLLKRGAALAVSELGQASASRAALTLSVERVMAGEALLLMPAAPGPAPTFAELESSENAHKFRLELLNLTNLASLSGLPVVTVPASLEGSPPIGVQLIGPKGSDDYLLKLSGRLEQVV